MMRTSGIEHIAVPHVHARWTEMDGTVQPQRTCRRRGRLT